MPGLCGCVREQHDSASATFHLLVIGLEGSGKTLLLKRLLVAQAKGKNVTLPADTMATIGTELFRLSLPRGATVKSLMAREVGGAMLPIWHHYFDECCALLFVVDMSSAATIASAAMELFLLLDDARLAGKPVCVALNKCDQPVTLTRGEVDALLRLQDLQKLHGGRLAVVQVSALTGEGADAVLQCLVTAVNAAVARPAGSGSLPAAGPRRTRSDKSQTKHGRLSNNAWGLQSWPESGRVVPA